MLGYDKLFERVFLLPLDQKSFKESSEIFSELRKKKLISGRFDTMIAGILISNGVRRIITRNTKHFNKIKRLKVISY